MVAVRIVMGIEHIGPHVDLDLGQMTAEDLYLPRNTFTQQLAHIAPAQALHVPPIRTSSVFTKTRRRCSRWANNAAS